MNGDLGEPVEVGDQGRASADGTADQVEVAHGGKGQFHCRHGGVAQREAQLCACKWLVDQGKENSETGLSHRGGCHRNIGLEDGARGENEGLQRRGRGDHGEVLEGEAQLRLQAPR